MKTASILAAIGWVMLIFSFTPPSSSPNILSYQVNPKTQELKLYWKDHSGNNYLNFASLRTELETKQQKLIFAMNGGMYLKDRSPQGLFIENGVTKKKINPVQNAYGNFYMQPNGIFYLTQNKHAVVCASSEFTPSKIIAYATQSGPMLLINGAIHPKFMKGSQNLHIRNGVGILPDGDVLFAISKELINFYDFATFFKNKGCKNALYLDGFVSRAYIPEQNWEQLDGAFGVIIGVTKNM
jgi:uncharacterized protein YigE (DUF2233 family)